MSVGTTGAAGQVLLYGVEWSTYEKLRADVGNRGLRMTYDQGELEIMSPSRDHEHVKKLIGRMIEAMTEELGIPISSGGSTTMKSELKKKGLEPDECYYIANEERMRGKDTFDVLIDPPPDLAVEVDVTSSSIDRMPLYAALGVPEVWRYDGTSLQVELLQTGGEYARQTQSGAFPFLPIEEFQRFLERRNETDETSWIRSFRSWVRQLR